jgi:uncharacterized membrane protein YqjE
MESSPNALSGDAPEPGWKARFAAVLRAAQALLATRAEIFREEVAEKRSLFAKAAVGLSLAVAFAGLALLIATALVASLLARLLGGPIAGLAASLVLYLAIAAAAAIFGSRKLVAVRPFEFPLTRDELRKDFDALQQEDEIDEEEPAGEEVLAAGRASVHSGEDPDGGGEGIREARVIESLEDRFRAGSE